MALSELEKSILRELHSKLVKATTRTQLENPAVKLETLLFGTDQEKSALAREYAKTETLPAIQQEVQKHSERGQVLLKRQRDLAAFLQS